MAATHWYEQWLQPTTVVSRVLRQHAPAWFHAEAEHQRWCTGIPAPIVPVIVLLAMLNLNVVLPVGHNSGATKDQESELLFGLSSILFFECL